jgi:RimJ/RimL family protein N-acetyltransferase
MADLDVIYQIFRDIGWEDENLPPAEQLARRRFWLQWSSMNHIALARLTQPPYGDRAVVRQENGELIGACGLVPAWGPFGQLPYFQQLRGRSSRFHSPEMGLMWAIAPAHQRHGYATEAAQALIDYAFGTLNTGRLIATTMYDNEPSMAVMRKLGMRIERNPFPEPPWFQVVGVLERGVETEENYTELHGGLTEE